MCELRMKTVTVTLYDSGIKRLDELREATGFESEGGMLSYLVLTYHVAHERAERLEKLLAEAYERAERLEKLLDEAYEREAGLHNRLAIVAEAHESIRREVSCIIRRDDLPENVYNSVCDIDNILRRSYCEALVAHVPYTSY